MSKIKLEPYYDLADVQRRFFPSRSIRWLKDRAKAGAFGAVVRDAGGWLLPESGITQYLQSRVVVQGGAQ